MKNNIRSQWTSLHATVVAVTKTFPFEAVAVACAMGFTHIGENRVSEAREKIEEAKKRGYTDIVWHMVGHVQSRKAREVVSLFDRVDSVDSIELLKKLDSAAGALNKKLHVLLEVNISGEQSKYGFNEIPSLVQYPHLTIDGLMTMAPYTKNAEDNRSYFRALKKLLETIRAQNPTIGRQLSMGTSCDYLVAIEEGATQVRLGTALFGPRR